MLTVMEVVRKPIKHTHTHTMHTAPSWLITKVTGTTHIATVWLIMKQLNGERSMKSISTSEDVSVINSMDICLITLITIRW